MKPYTPVPRDTSKVELSSSLAALMEELAKNTHEVWATERIRQGWTYGPQRNDALKQHPSLVPYEDLTDDEKKFDRKTASETLKFILSLGYLIQEPSNPK